MPKRDLTERIKSYYLKINEKHQGCRFLLGALASNRELSERRLWIAALETEHGFSDFGNFVSTLDVTNEVDLKLARTNKIRLGKERHFMEELAPDGPELED